MAVRLPARLALPVAIAAVVVTAAVTVGLYATIHRTGAVATRQAQGQFTRITEHALAERGQVLHEMAVVFASARGDIRARDRAWRHPPVAAAAVLERGTGRVRSALGAVMHPADLRAAAAAGRVAGHLVRTGEGLLLAGAASGDRSDEVVVVAQRLDVAFVRALGDVVRTDVAVEGGGIVVATFAAGAQPAETVPVRIPLETAGGGAATVTLFLPAGDARRARHMALVASLAGGGVLLLGALAFYAWIAASVTGPIRDLIAATDRLAAGELARALPEGAPAELGTLVARFNRMASALREAEARLVHSAKLSSIGALVAGVSHELNNPLYGLLGHAELLLAQGGLDAPSRERLDLILREGRRMQRTLSELRGFTRPSARERGRVDLGQVAREVLALVEHDAESGRAVRRPEIAADEAAVIGAPDELRQVMLNLVLNALQAMPDGGTLVVRVGGRGNRVAVAVEDTGTGIPAGILARVREPFFSTKPGRMGLGLAIAYEIVTAHGGALVLENLPGGGVRASFDLPGAGVPA